MNFKTVLALSLVSGLLTLSAFCAETLRIHGNNNPKRVGRRVTGGCFVMDNTEGLALAHRVRVGTEVNIVP